ncbi:hypothetical protein PM082_015516 [Marasmius tenuissimus]|nr:hypothetical protein PM082_015516 [Marasmius tenuissimus]
MNRSSLTRTTSITPSESKLNLLGTSVTTNEGTPTPPVQPDPEPEPKIEVHEVLSAELQAKFAMMHARAKLEAENSWVTYEFGDSAGAATAGGVGAGTDTGGSAATGVLVQARVYWCRRGCGCYGYARGCSRWWGYRYSIDTVLLIVNHYFQHAVEDMEASHPGDESLSWDLGIASTLVIVRSVLGIAINDEKSYRATVLGEGDWNEGAHRMIDSYIDIGRRDEAVVVTGISDEENLACMACRKKSEKSTD